jgi:cytochrome c-type biogenesis protein CcmH
MNFNLPLLLTFLFLCSYAYAESGEYERSLNIQKNIMSPFCPGQILYNCPSEKATELKDEIEKALQEGKTEEAVIADIQERFPSATYAAPPAKGIGLYVWLVPGVFVVLISFVAALWFRVQLRKKA